MDFNRTLSWNFIRVMRGFIDLLILLQKKDFLFFYQRGLNIFLKRHSVNENWNYINPGSLSAGILWGDSNDIKENLKDYMKEFNIK